jgi:hypothetical protein
MLGMEFILDKFLRRRARRRHRSSPLKSDIVIADPQIAPQHAILKGKAPISLSKTQHGRDLSGWQEDRNRPLHADSTSAWQIGTGLSREEVSYV